MSSQFFDVLDTLVLGSPLLRLRMEGVLDKLSGWDRYEEYKMFAKTREAAHRRKSSFDPNASVMVAAHRDLWISTFHLRVQSPCFCHSQVISSYTVHTGAHACQRTHILPRTAQDANSFRFLDLRPTDRSETSSLVSGMVWV